MTPEQKAAVLIARAVNALAEIEGMKSANMDRQSLGYSMCYPDTDFFTVAERFKTRPEDIEELFKQDGEPK